jgi:D-3-phosphoglycerate dehydrogenase
MEKLLCSRFDDPIRLEQLNALGIEVVHLERLPMENDEAFINVVQGHDYVISGPGRWNANVFADLRGSLKMAVKFGVGVDNFDIPAATRAGIAVANAPGSNAEAVAEHAVTLMLAILRRIEQASGQVRQGVWKIRCDTLVEKTVGLYGFGQIARKVAQFLSGFPVTLLTHDVVAPEAGQFPQVQQVSLGELLARSDILSLHVPLNDDTRGQVNADFLARMKKGAYLVNTARGGLVNEPDLVVALQSGQLAGAGLDTFSSEPLPSTSPLLQLDNVILTPHCASNTAQAYRKILACCLDNVIAFKTGQGDAHILNPEYKEYL